MRSFRLTIWLLVSAWLSISCQLNVFGQTSDDASKRDAAILQQLDRLAESLNKTQAELAASRAEISELRTRLDAIEGRQTHSSSPDTVDSTVAGQTDQTAPAPAKISEDDWQVLTERVRELHQTKVESGSKSRVKLSGLLLVNAVGASGNTDQLDVPQVATPERSDSPSGYVGGSVRQSIIGLTGYGPDFLGAHTSGDLQMDFFGGLTNTYYGMTGGIARLRTGSLRLDWQNTSVSGGLETPLFSPLSPTSYLTVAEPALSSAGNLWTWTPQVSVEHRLEFDSTELKLRGGLLDPISIGAVMNTYERTPTPGESTRQPAYAFHASFGNRDEDRPVVVGVGGFYSPQDFGYGYSAHNWASTLDWQIGYLRRLQFTGEFFTGKGMEGFGGAPIGTSSSYYSNYPPDYSYAVYANVRSWLLDRLTAMGGWGQVKVKVNTRSEFNLAGGYGGVNSTGLRNASQGNVYLTGVPARNQTFFANYVLRPRSNLLFSAEYRHLRTYGVTYGPETANIVGLAAGFEF